LIGICLICWIIAFLLCKQNQLLQEQNQLQRDMQMLWMMNNTSTTTSSPSAPHPSFSVDSSSQMMQIRTSTSAPPFFLIPTTMTGNNPQYAHIAHNNLLLSVVPTTMTDNPYPSENASLMMTKHFYNPSPSSLPQIEDSSHLGANNNL
jgi:hypothetical protein